MLESLIEMDNWTEGYTVGEGGFLLGIVDCGYGGKELFFWVFLLQGLEDLGRLESRIGELLDFLVSFIVELSVDDMASWIGRRGMIVARVADREFPNACFLL